MHYGMLILGIISSLFSMEGIILTFIYPPYPYGLLISAFIALFSVVFCEIAKTKILIEKMEKRAMLILILFICESLFFLILALSVLIFLSQVQEGQFSLNAKLSSFILQGNPLNFGEISWINLLFYFGNTITIGFYAR